jgi:anti-sigma regulatory factor (Ser/Thr protein kinase)
MITKEAILKLARQNGKVLTADLTAEFNVSRQYASRLIGDLVRAGQLLKAGETRSAFYVLPEYASKHPQIQPFRFARTFKNAGLQELKVVEQLDQALPRLKKLPENIRSIFTYAFSEMLNNAMEHSGSKTIHMEAAIEKKMLSFTVDDYGVGVFRNVVQQRKLKSEFEAMQDLLKGKTTTMPQMHSGEGIFFTSKAGDLFVLDSFGYRLIVNNELPDVFFEKTDKIKKGTRVTFQVKTTSRRRLNAIFQKYTNIGVESDQGFDKTEVKIKLYTLGGVHISRSQARRVLAGMEKFRVIVFDFDKVPLVGQAFADEIFRVFHHKYPHIRLETEHMTEGAKFMVERAKAEAGRSQL